MKRGGSQVKKLFKISQNRFSRNLRKATWKQASTAAVFPRAEPVKKGAFWRGRERLQQLFGGAKIANANAGKRQKTPVKQTARRN
jgi:hypothetical protein